VVKLYIYNSFTAKSHASIYYSFYLVMNLTVAFLQSFPVKFKSIFTLHTQMAGSPT